MFRFKLVHDNYEMLHYVVDTKTTDRSKKVRYECNNESEATKVCDLMNELDRELTQDLIKQLNEN